MAPSPNHLSDDAVAEFWRDGAICCRGLFDDWVEPMRVAIDEVLDDPGPLGFDVAPGGHKRTGRSIEESFYIEVGVWNRHEMFRRIALDSPAPELAAQLLDGSKVDLIFDQLFIKEPFSDAQRTPWHQDIPYWPIKGRDVVSVWVAFDEVTSDTGSVVYAKGTHTWDRHFRPNSFTADGKPMRGMEGEVLLDSEPIEGAEEISWDVKPGDCLIHHGWILHSAPGNSSGEQRRRAHAIRYGGDDIVWDPRPDVVATITPLSPLPINLQAGEPLGGEAFPRII